MAFGDTRLTAYLRKELEKRGYVLLLNAKTICSIAVAQKDAIIMRKEIRGGYIVKQLVCEMCGGTDLVKQDGVFVCQSCGTKYSVEEAKKMMVEGVVDVQGTVKVDSSEKLNNLYQVARRAKESNDTETAAKYYDMILIEDPTSWEASFYSVYFRSMSCRIGQIPSAAASVSNCLPSVFNLIIQNEDPNSIQTCVSEVHVKTLNAATTFLFGACNSFASIRTEHPAQFVPDLSTRSFASVDVAYTLGTIIDKMFGTYAWAQKLVVTAFTTGNSLMSSYITVMRPRSFLETAPIHGTMESKANSVISTYKGKISQAESKMNQIKADEERKAAEAQAERNRLYWESHAIERTQIEKEIAKLNIEKAPLISQIETYEEQANAYSEELIFTTPADEEKQKIDQQVNELTNQLCNLKGLFKGKERKAIQEQINIVRAKLPPIEARIAEYQQQNNIVNAQVQQKIDSVNSQIQTIQGKINSIDSEIEKLEHELTKNR